jgi:hypothetical protein
MRQHLDFAKLCARALRQLPQMIDDQAPLPLSPICPVSLDELLAELTAGLRAKCESAET